MLSREEQLLHEIENTDISAREAIDIMIDIEAYGFIADIVTLEMSKSDREYLIANLDKSLNARHVGPFLEILKDEDEIEDFISITLKSGYEKALVGMSIVNKKFNKNLWTPVIKQMAGKSSEYVTMITMLLEKMLTDGDGITEEQFLFFYHSTSSRDFANIISDKAFILPNFIMKIVFEIAKDLMNLDNNPVTSTNPPAAGLLLNAIDVNMDAFPNKYDFEEPFKMYMYKYTKREEYLPQGIKDVFVF